MTQVPDDFAAPIAEEDDAVERITCQLCGASVSSTPKDALLMPGLDVVPPAQFCLRCAQAIHRSYLDHLRDQDICDHGVVCGEWCPDCREEYHNARIENGDAE